MFNSIKGKKLLKDLQSAFSNLPHSIPDSWHISKHDTLIGESLTNHSSDVDAEYAFFDDGLVQIFGHPDIGLTFPERGRWLNDLVEDFEVMLDKIDAGPDSFKHFENDVMHWGNALITSAEALHNTLHSPQPLKLHTSNHTANHPKVPRDGIITQKDNFKSLTSAATSAAKTSHTKQTTLSFIKAIPTNTMQPFPQKQQPPINHMRPGVLPFVTITSKEADVQLK